MDYVFASILRHYPPQLRKVASYDIACQWSIHLLERMAALPSHIRPIIPSGTLRYAIPKLHIESHKLHCQLNYSLNLLPGAGRTDGEGIKRSWANMGLVANSTKEMGPGARHDTIDDHWGNWNWQKTVSLGKFILPLRRRVLNAQWLGLAFLLRKRLRAAIPESVAQKEAFDVFSEKQSAHVLEWKEMVLAWEADQSQPNPYEIPKTGTSALFPTSMSRRLMLLNIRENRGRNSAKIG